MFKKISIIGDGGWGTTLAVHLAKKKYPVTLWGPFQEYIAEMRRTRRNPKFLPGIVLPRAITLTNDLANAINSSDLIVFAVPSKFAVNVLKQIKKTKIPLRGKTVLSVTKGFDFASLKTMSQLIKHELPEINIAVLSGPTIAVEVARGIPSTAVVACRHSKLARQIQNIFNSSSFRIYTNTDMLGVEIGGSIKNVVAIACGVCDGLGYGSNTKAAVVTRGLVEISRLGKAMGARPETFIGLSGLGDLITTCVSPKSRNRTVGEELGKGKSANNILKNMQMVAEGVETVRGAIKLGRRFRVNMPITMEVYNIIYKGKSPRQAVNDLMKRKPKVES